MAFISPRSGRSPTIVGTDFIGRNQGYGSGSDFANNLNRIIKPGVNFNTQINLNLGKGDNPGSPSLKGDGPNIPNKGDNGGGSGSGRPNKKYSPSKRPYFAPSEVKTSPISFVTNIKSGTLINPFEASNSKTTSSLFTLSGSFLPVSPNSGSIFEQLMLGKIYFNFITKLQQEVNFRIIREIPNKSLLNYFVSISNALQLYYSVDSILAYTSVTSNNNVGMTYLRKGLTAEILSKQEELKRSLLNCAIPPNLLSFIAYMYQNFRFESLDESAIFKLEFRTIFHDTSSQGLSPEYYDVIIAELWAQPTIISILLKGIPSFRVTELIASSAEPLFDANFKTFWYNSNSTYIDNKQSKLIYSRSADSVDHDIYYGSFCNEDVDGIFYACSSLFLSPEKTCEPGLWAPFSDFKALSSCLDSRQRSSLLCYDTPSDRLISPCSQRTASQSGLFHSLYYLADAESKFVSDLNINPSSQKVQVHNINNTTAAVSQSVLFLFSETD
jgi:hypothetical protein